MQMFSAAHVPVPLKSHPWLFPCTSQHWAAGGAQSAGIPTNRCSPGKSSPEQEQDGRISEARAENEHH